MTRGPSGPLRCSGLALRFATFKVLGRIRFEALLNRKRPAAGAKRAPIASGVAVAAEVRDPARIAKPPQVPIKRTTHASHYSQQMRPTNFQGFSTCGSHFSQRLRTCRGPHVEQTATRAPRDFLRQKPVAGPYCRFSAHRAAPKAAAVNARKPSASIQICDG